MQVIACQTDIAWHDKAANFSRVQELLAPVGIRPGALVVLPEMFATGFSLDVPQIAETEGGPTDRFLAELAARYECCVVAGVVRQKPSGKAVNLCVVFSADGSMLASYEKLHPFSFGGEDRLYERGKEVEIFEQGDFSVAPLVCYDLRFPEVFRHAVLQGAQLLVVIANWPKERDEHWTALLKARAIENQAYVVGVNRVGRDPHLEYIGHSQIIDPRGHIVAAAAEGPAALVADVELAEVLEYRQSFPALRDMRPEFLGKPGVAGPRTGSGTRP